MENIKLSFPEQAGVPSQALSDFLSRLEARRIPLHGFVLMRDEKIAAEGYCPPFSENSLHRMYSASKSFVSAAIGILISQGKLRLTDRPADLLPDKAEGCTDPNILGATIRDLLRMAGPHAFSPYQEEGVTDWVSSFFHPKKPTRMPGQMFIYDTSNTVTLTAIVERITGKCLLDFLRDCGLAEAGFSPNAYCIQTPCGVSWAGSGILCTTRDLALFGSICMNGGRWHGKAIMDPDYLAEATSRQISSLVNSDHPFFQYGYGYQFWQFRYGFACYGMGAQLALCVPEKGVVLAITADTQALPSGIDAVLDAACSLFSEIADSPLDRAPEAEKAFFEKAGSLRIPLPIGDTEIPDSFAFFGKTFRFQENPMGLKWMRVQKQDNAVVWEYENASGAHSLTLGLGDYVEQLFPELYDGKRISSKDTQYRCMGTACFPLPNELDMLLYIVDDYLGSLKASFYFEDNHVCVLMKKTAEWFLEEYDGLAFGIAD